MYNRHVASIEKGCRRMFENKTHILCIRYLIVCALFFYSIPTLSNAALLSYSVSGTLSGYVNNNLEDYAISGNMLIDDSVVSQSMPGYEVCNYNIGLSSLQITQISNPSSTLQYTWSSGSINFAGVSGSSFVFRNGWGLSSAGANWDGIDFSFYNSDMSMYQTFDDFAYLAPIIQLNGLWAWNAPFSQLYPFETDQSGPVLRMTLTQSNAVSPVPEPSVFILSSFGLLGIGLLRRKLSVKLGDNRNNV